MTVPNYQTCEVDRFLRGRGITERDELDAIIDIFGCDLDGYHFQFLLDLLELAPNADSFRAMLTTYLKANSLSPDDNLAVDALVAHYRGAHMIYMGSEPLSTSLHCE